MSRVWLFVAGLCAALLLGEGLVRLAGAGEATLSRGSLHAFHSEFGWTCAPGLDSRYVLAGNFDARIVCNELGQRGRRVPEARTPGTSRILVLGDSFMWGYGVENDEMLPERLTQLLPDTEVVNLAASGYSTVQELVRLESEGLAYAPDLTLLGFTWNDLGDNFDEKKGGRPIVAPRKDGGFEILNRPVRRPWKAAHWQWLRHNSRLVSFVDYARQVVRAELGIWRHERAKRKRAPGVPRWDRRDQRPLDFSPRELYGEESAELDLAWKAVENLLARADAVTRESGSRLLVIANANRQTMVPAAFERMFGDDAALDWDRPSRRLAEICQRLGIDFIDLNPVFRREADPTKLFFPKNSHWSPRGHELAARVVAEHLRAPRVTPTDYVAPAR